MRLSLLFLLISLNCFGSNEKVVDYQDVQEQEVKYDTAPAPTPVRFKEEKISFFKEQPAFDYTERSPQESWWYKFKRYIKLKGHSFLEWLFGDYKAEGVILFLLKLLPYLIVAGVLVFLVWLINKLYPASSNVQESVQGKVFLSDEEEIIQSQDIEKLIRSALSEGKFKLAIRYHYLFILQLLTKKEIIAYEFSKTNEDYSKEIKEKLIQEHFRQLSLIYDFIWYGNFIPDQDTYGKAEKQFGKMRELIAKQNGSEQ